MKKRHCLVGIDEFQTMVKSISANVKKYSFLNEPPDSVILKLDRGEGRSAVVEFAANTFKDDKVLDFTSSRDKYIECDFSGALNNYNRNMDAVKSAGEYAECYEGVIGVHCTGIADCYAEDHYKDFICEFKKICQHAFVIFFFSAQPSKNEEKMIKALSEELDIRVLTAGKYTSEQLALISLLKMEKEGILFKSCGAVILSTDEAFYQTCR